ncbi:MAG: Flp pilus assembly protein CpaB [Magnetovibrionaceae bacterium]
MSARTLILVVLALVAAVGTGLYAKSWMAAERAEIAKMKPKVEKTADVVQVLVAKQPMAVGTFLKQPEMTWRTWPADGVGPDFMVKGRNPVEALDGAVVRTPLAKGEPIIMSKIVRPGQRGFLAAVLEPGMRAVSVPVNATTGISGFVFPGDQVDLLLTTRYKMTELVEETDEVDENPRSFTTTLLNDLRVLARDQATQTVDGKPRVTKTATLEVTTKQAEIIALGLQMGDLSLSLRSLARDETDDGDDRFVQVARQVGAIEPSQTQDPARDFATTVTSEYDVISAFEAAIPKPKPQKTGSSKPRNTVDIVRGSDVSQSTF